MILSHTQEYCLRIAAVLALHYTEGKLIPSEQIAAETGVPRAYISKILRQLVVAELVHAEKGHRGGFRLQRLPEEIRFANLLEAVGAVIEDKSCVFGFDKCNNTKPCPLHQPWANLRSQITNWTEQTTLAALSGDKNPLRG